MNRTASSFLPERPTGRRDAFTVAELMTSLVLLSVLTMLGYWAVGRATASSRSVECTSQLRQIYAALLLYTQDNRGMLPPATEPNSRDYSWDVPWRGPWCAPRERPELGFPGYVVGGVETARRLSICPVNLRVTPEYFKPTHFRHYYLCNYDLMTSSGYSDPPARLSQVQLPNTVLLLESATGEKWQSVGIASRVFQTEVWSRIGEPHSGTLNVLWADGHVTNTLKNALERKDFTRKPR